MVVKLLGDGGVLSSVYPFIGLVIAYIYPISRSCRAILTRDEEAYHQWLTYWMVFFIIRLMEGLVDLFMSRLPFYREVKLAFITWLVLPGFKGASIIYHQLIHKYLEQYETDIDGHIVKLTDHARKAAWEVSSTVVKVMTPNGMALVQAAVATGAAVSSGDTSAIFQRNKLQTASLPAPVRVNRSEPSSRPRSTSRLTSPFGATPSHILTSLLGVLADGMFVHLSFDGDRASEAPSMHLLRLSANRRSLVYDDVANSQLETLLLVSIVSIKAGKGSECVDLMYLSQNDAGLQRLTIVAGNDTDRDALLAGFRLLLASMKEPYAQGAKVLTRALLRHSFRQWARASRQAEWGTDEEEEEEEEEEDDEDEEEEDEMEYK